MSKCRTDIPHLLPPVPTSSPPSLLLRGAFVAESAPPLPVPRSRRVLTARPLPNRLLGTGLNTHPLDPPHDFSRIPSLATARLGFAGPSPSRAAHSTYTEQSYTASFPTQNAVQTGVGAMYKSSRASAQAASERCAALFAPPPCTEAPRHASPTPWAACAQRALPLPVAAQAGRPQRTRAALHQWICCLSQAEP